ncbi:LacI family transcriptional regulator, partial [Escherichia coli]|nr:LacI family transcriptional regulator [Escherichia coli]
MVGQSGESYDSEVRLCENFYEHKVCGVIVSQAKDTLQYDHFKKLIDHDMPLVFYDRICTGINCSRVVVDDYMGAYNAVSHLIDTGCRRIACYSSPMTMEISKNRYNGYRDALLKHHLQPEERFFRICDNRADAELITPDLLSQQE